MTGLLAPGVYITTTNSDIMVYQVSSGTTSSFSIQICNQSGSDVQVWVALTPSSAGSPSPSHYIESNVIIPAGESYRIPGIVLSSQEKVFVKTNIANVSVNIFGFEQ